MGQPLANQPPLVTGLAPIFAGYAQRVEQLFQQHSLSSYLTALNAKLRDVVRQWDADEILNLSTTDLVAYLVARYSLDVPVLDTASAHISAHGDTQIDVTGNHMRTFTFLPGPQYVQGSSVSITVPFTGDPDLFQFQASTWSTGAIPRAKVGKSALVLVYREISLTDDQVRARYEADVAAINTRLGWLRDQADGYHRTLEARVEALVAERRNKVLADRSMVEGVGLPIKLRRSEPSTYAVPDVRRRPSITKPTATRAPYKVEPTLDQAEYDRILETMTHMAHVMERSPNAFRSMGEEDLRWHFLMQLNGLYEGEATGETFNSEGKTDILIRHDDRNVFIAECKYWNGPSVVSTTIDQILAYLSWRDTKTAILLFVRNKNFGAVVEQIVPLVEGHEYYKKTLDRVSETEFRFILGQRADKNRELRLAVMLFPVPIVP